MTLLLSLPKTMKPIQVRAELALVQGLRCVQYRPPNRFGFKPRAYACAVGLRYGLIGAAAATFSLEIADPVEERDLNSVFRYWPLMVAEHFKTEMSYRVAIQLDELAPATIARLSSAPLKLCLGLRKQFLPLSRILEIASEVFHRDHRNDVIADHWLFGKTHALKIFRDASQESIRFANCFFERQRAGLDEVSEIALLGE